MFVGAFFVKQTANLSEEELPFKNIKDFNEFIAVTKYKMT